MSHIYFRDKNLVDSFCDTNVDFVIWITPFKDLPGNLHFMPQVCIFDMKRSNEWKKNLIEYKEDDLVCMEVE